MLVEVSLFLIAQERHGKHYEAFCTRFLGESVMVENPTQRASVPLEVVFQFFSKLLSLSSVPGGCISVFFPL